MCSLLTTPNPTGQIKSEKKRNTTRFINYIVTWSDFTGARQLPFDNSTIVITIITATFLGMYSKKLMHKTHKALVACDLNGELEEACACDFFFQFF